MASHGLPLGVPLAIVAPATSTVGAHLQQGCAAAGLALAARRWPRVAAVRDALSDYPELTALLGSNADQLARDVRAISREVAEAWTSRHRSQYVRFGRVLPALIGELEATPCQ